MDMKKIFIIGISFISVTTVAIIACNYSEKIPFKNEGLTETNHIKPKQNILLIKSGSKSL